MKRLFIFDPSLADAQGHHFTLTLNATHSAQACGFAVTWLCSTEFDATALAVPDGIGVQTILSWSMYDAYRQDGNDGQQTGESFAAMLASAMDYCAMTKEDRVLFHTADGVTYLGIELALRDRPPSTTPIMHVCTPYDPKGVMPNRENVKGITRAINTMKSAGLIERSLFLYGENKYLAAHLETLWNVPVTALNLPFGSQAEPSRAACYQFRREQLGIGTDDILCTYLGSARLEKGYQKLPFVIQHVQKILASKSYAHTDVPSVHFAIQSSKQVVGYHPDIVTAINRIEALDADNVTLLHTALANDFYYNLLFASDIMMMPYELKEYRVRGSGIVIEALNACATIVATDGTYPGMVAEETGGAVATTPKEFAQAIVKLAKDGKHTRKRARQASHIYRAQSDAANYWPSCLERETLYIEVKN